MTSLQLIGSRITKIHAEKNEAFDGKVSMKNNIRINSIEKVKKAKETLRINYFFEVLFGELGFVIIEGALFLAGNNKTLKEIQKTHEEKDIESKEQAMLTNIVFQRASLKALEIENEMGLPTHIKLPSLNVTKK